MPLRTLGDAAFILLYRPALARPALNRSPCPGLVQHPSCRRRRHPSSAPRRCVWEAWSGCFSRTRWQPDSLAAALAWLEGSRTRWQPHSLAATLTWLEGSRTRWQSHSHGSKAAALARSTSLKGTRMARCAGPTRRNLQGQRRSGCGGALSSHGSGRRRCSGLWIWVLLPGAFSFAIRTGQRSAHICAPDSAAQIQPHRLSRTDSSGPCSE